MGSKRLARPPRLERGQRVALVAPAGPLLDRDDLHRAEALCRALDYVPVLGRHAGARHGYLAGADDDRLADLNQAIADPAIDAIWCVRGGYGVTPLLHPGAFPPLPRRPQGILGDSENTA